MEKLAGNVVSEVLPEKPRRDIYLLLSETLESVIGQVSPSSHHFGLFLALDASSLDANQIGKLAESLLKKAWLISVLGDQVVRGFTTFRRG